MFTTEWCLEMFLYSVHRCMSQILREITVKLTNTDNMDFFFKTLLTNISEMLIKLFIRKKTDHFKIKLKKIRRCWDFLLFFSFIDLLCSSMLWCHFPYGRRRKMLILILINNWQILNSLLLRHSTFITTKPD